MTTPAEPYEASGGEAVAITMHPEDEITLMTVAAGMQPTIIVKIVPDEHDGDEFQVQIETWGIPQSYAELAEFFTEMGELITENLPTPTDGQPS